MALVSKRNSIGCCLVLCYKHPHKCKKTCCLMSTEGTKALVFIRNAIGCCLVLCDKHCNNGEKTRIRLSHLFLFDSGSCFREVLRLRNRQPFRKYTKYKHLLYFDLSKIRTHWYPLEHIGTLRNRSHPVILQLKKRLLQFSR